MKPGLELKLLGTPKINLAGQSLGESLSSKAQAILYYLALSNEPQSRAALATLLWGDLPESAARTNLRKALANLRQALGDYLELGHQEISFKAKEQLWVDAVEFETAVSSLLQRPEGPIAVQQLQEATHLYGGDLLTGFYVLHAPDFESWLLAEQTRLRELMVQALQALAEGYAGQEAWPAGLACLRRLLSLEPWREEAHRQLMLFLVYSGQRSVALAQLETCRRALEEELGVEPGPETVALYEHIREGKVGPKAAEPTGVLFERPQTAAEPVSPSSTPEAPQSVYNLPAPSTPFVGRTAELADILRRLTDKACRLLTLAGPGGIGKTRLALQAARAFVGSEAAGFFAHGVVFVSLVEADSGGSMISAIAKAANFTFYNNGAPRQQLLNYLHGKNMLLVLDNLEHLLEEGAPLISEILAAAPEIKILVTSREALNLQEAWFHPVEGMSFPGEVEANVALEKYDAVQLFVQSAGRVRVEFSLAAEQAHVVRICRLVEGMPLGIELAAAWLKVLPAAQIVQEIEKGLQILTTRLQNMPERHHSLRAVFEQSWQLLTPEEQAVLKQLAVFRGSFSQEAAEQVAGASFFSLAVLVEKSLVRVTETGRYQMHELLRQFAAEKLATGWEEGESAYERHSSYYLEFLKRCEKRLRGKEQRQALIEIGQEIDNIRTAWIWAIAHYNLEIIDQTTDSLYDFYQIRSRYQEGQELFSGAISSWRQADPAKYKVILSRLEARHGAFCYFLGDYEAATQHLQAGLQTASSPAELAFSQHLLGNMARLQGQRAAAEAHLGKALELSREIGDQNGSLEALLGLADVAGSFGDYKAGKQLASEGLDLSRQLERPNAVARALSALGWSTSCLGAYGEAETYYKESLTISQEIGDQNGVALALEHIGWIAWCTGGARLEEATTYYKKALAIYREIGERSRLSMCLADLALALNDRGEYAQVQQYAREGLAITETTGNLGLMAYNLYCLGIAAGGLGNFRASRNYLIKALRIAWEAQILDHTLNVLFYYAALLVKESLKAERPDLVKAQVLTLLALVSHHPVTWQATKDRVALFQAELEAELPLELALAAKTEAKERPLEKFVLEILSGDPTGFRNP